MNKDVKVTQEKMVIKNSKKDIDSLIQKIKDNKGHLQIAGDFNVRLDYCDNINIKEIWRGFSITINPAGRDGRGISIQFDPYDNKICSGLIEVLEENE